MATTYEKVASVIGTEMDKAWKNIMEQLATANVSVMSSPAGASITNVELQDFFKNLGGAHMAINFSSITPKGEVTRFSAYELQPSAGITTMGVEGSISIGVNIKF